MRDKQTASESLEPCRRAGRAAALCAAALALLVCAPVAARAQEQEGAKGEAAVRERRASKGEEATKTKTKSESAVEAVATEAGDEAELEELRARVESEKNAAERGRLQRTLVERLSAAGRKAEAVAVLRTMLSEERVDPPFFYNTGNALARLGESEAAVEAYRKAVAQRRGNYARAQHNLGVVLVRLGRWEEAEESLTAALKLENNTYAEASYNLGRLHALRGEAGLAIVEWTRTLRLDPAHDDAAVALARTLAADGDPDEALNVLDSFASRAARRGAVAPREITVARGEILAAANVAAAPESNAKSGGTVSVSVGELRAEGGAAKSSSSSTAVVSDDREALRLIREARPGGPRPLKVNRETYDLLRRARSARSDERHDEAAELYARAIESGGGYFLPANVELSFTLAALRRREEAVAGLLAVIRREGARYPIAFYHLGRYYELLGRFEQAGEAFARVAQLMGDESPQFYIDASRVREKEGKLAEALAAAEAYVRLMERTGAAPAWARERVARLREKATPAAVKN